MAGENAETPNETSAEDSALETLAVESGVVDDTPDPVAEPTPEPATEEPKPEEDKPKTALEAVRKVMAESREKDERAVKDAEPVKDAPEAEKKEVAAEPDPKKDLLTKAEWASLSDRAKARIGALGNEVKAERKAREELAPRAQMFDEMAEYVASTGMTQEQFVEGLNIMGWLVTDPARAYEALKPIIADLQGHMGELLPADLQAQVDDGRITPELAQQLVFERSQRTLLETKTAQRLQQQQDLDAQREAEASQARGATEVKRTIADWQSRKMASDPDFRYKAAQISDRAYVLIKNENPTTNEQLLNLLDRAKGEVDKRVAGQQPRRAKSPVTTAGAGGTINREPTTALEAARIALASMPH